MTISAAGCICNSDGVSYRHGRSRRRLFVCLSLSTAQRFGRGSQTKKLSVYDGGKKLGLLSKMAAGDENNNSAVNLVITFTVIRVMMAVMIIY